MPDYSINDDYYVPLGNVEEAKNELLTRGFYNVSIDWVEAKRSASSGIPMLAFIFTVEDGEFEGRKLFYNASFSEKALPFTKRALMKICPDLIDEHGGIYAKRVETEETLVGRSLKVKVNIAKNKSSGEMQNNITDFFAGDKSGFEFEKIPAKSSKEINKSDIPF